MLTVYGRRTSANVMKVLWLVEEIGLEYERIDVGGPFGRIDTAEYLAMNPNGLIPTIDDDGFVLWESNTIVRYLANRYANGVFYPEHPHTRARASQWMDWCLSTITPIMTPIFWGLVRQSPEQRDDAAIEAAAERGRKAWAILDRRLDDQPYVAGDDFTMGDIALGPHAHRWFQLVEERPRMPYLEDWYRRLTERPDFRKVCMIPME